MLALLLGFDPPQEPLSGAEVLSRCMKAYDAVKTMDVKARGNFKSFSGTAHISFSRPGRLRVSGKTFGKSRYELLSTPSGTWTFLGGKWDKAHAIENGVASITGVSVNAGTMVPALLMHTEWGGLKPFLKGSLATQRQTINGRKTIRVTATHPRKMKFWIDERRYFLVKTEAEFPNTKIVVEYEPPKVNQPIPASRFKR